MHTHCVLAAQRACIVECGPAKSHFSEVIWGTKERHYVNDSTLFTVKTKIKKMISARAGGAYSEEVLPSECRGGESFVKRM